MLSTGRPKPNGNQYKFSSNYSIMLNDFEHGDAIICKNSKVSITLNPQLKTF